MERIKDYGTHLLRLGTSTHTILYCVPPNKL
jgi:hypothetical protein